MKSDSPLGAFWGCWSWFQIENCLTGTFKCIISLSAALFVFYDCSFKWSLRCLFGWMIIYFLKLGYQKVLHDCVGMKPMCQTYKSGNENIIF